MSGRRDKFAKFTRYEEESRAFRELSLPAKFTYLLIKLNKRHSYDNEITLTYKEAGYHMDERTFTRAIRELIEKGFIEKTRPGGLFGRKSVYKIVRKDWRP